MVTAASGRVMSREEVDAELKRVEAEEDEISAALLELEDRAGNRLLHRAKLTGVPAQRWQSATTAIEANVPAAVGDRDQIHIWARMTITLQSGGGQ
jgi:acetylglutamate synthase